MAEDVAAMRRVPQKYLSDARFICRPCQGGLFFKPPPGVTPRAEDYAPSGRLQDNVQTPNGRLGEATLPV
jgi:hypothetical protein